MSSLIAWILRAIPFGTIIMYGALGETLTEKSGNLNLGVPGIMYLGGFAGFASAYYYEKLSANPSAFVCVILALLCALIASALGGLIYAFLTITLRANQNDIPKALQLYQACRTTRTARIVLSGREMGRIYHAAGIERKIRNSLWKGRS